MSAAHARRERPLRVWPGVIAVAAAWLFLLAAFLVAPPLVPWAMLGGLICGLAVLVWWLGFSRAPWVERLAAVILIVTAVFVARRLADPSIQNGMMGLMLPIYSVPVMSLVLVIWAAASRRLAAAPRRALLVAAIALACVAFAAVRTEGITGDARPQLHWRWTATPEERLLARVDVPRAVAPSTSAAPSDERAAEAVDPATALGAETEPTAGGAATSAAEAPAELAPWPGFRGPRRDGVVRGVRIATDWTRTPPVEMWRRPVGPGWSSFAVDGHRVFTQEQRGEDEVVSCYDSDTGEPVWMHADAARFWESNAGAGPRGTPTLAAGRVYTLGGTGILNALDARDGSVVWSRNAAVDTETETPGWGFAGSPLVVGDLVIAATAGRLAAYDARTGEPRWLGPRGGGGYGSPHLSTIAGVPQVLFQSGTGTTSLDPADGRVLWSHDWPGDGIVQPIVLGDGELLLGSGSGMAAGVGVRRVAVARNGSSWDVTERWTSPGLKPYFNDFVVHEGHAYGFDGGILACIDLASGERRWKGGRYGHGQLVLLEDQGLLLVLSEKGEVALVRARGEAFEELARRPAIEGKTWNHPVVAGDVLLVRNDQEMAAFRLPRPAGGG